jgi:hypothetical protein
MAGPQTQAALGVEEDHTHVEEFAEEARRAAASFDSQTTLGR